MLKIWNSKLPKIWKLKLQSFWIAMYRKLKKEENSKLSNLEALEIWTYENFNFSFNIENWKILNFEKLQNLKYQKFGVHCSGNWMKKFGKLIFWKWRKWWN